MLIIVAAREGGKGGGGREKLVSRHLMRGLCAAKRKSQIGIFINITANPISYKEHAFNFSHHNKSNYTGFDKVEVTVA